MRKSLRLGLAVTTVGRPHLRDLLLSAAAAAEPPVVVAVANQSGRADDPFSWRFLALPFQIRVAMSSGGVSQGRNDAIELLEHDIDLVATPNDDTRYPPDAFTRVREAFERSPTADAIAGSFLDHAAPYAALPTPGTPLDRRTVWRAKEPALILRASTLRNLGGFRIDLGAGSATAWQSGEGTDLLLRLIDSGGRVVSAPAVRALGRGERRDLDEDEWVLKNRRYARGTGYVYRIHGYPRSRWVAVVVAPWIRAVGAPGRPNLRLRVAAARSIGRAEGLFGRPLPTVSPRHEAR